MVFSNTADLIQKLIHMKRNLGSTLLWLGMVVVIFGGGCSDPDPPEATITVFRIDPNDPKLEVAVAGATVRIYCTPGAGGKAVCRDEVEEIIKTTDASGKVSEKFDLNMVLRVEAYIDYAHTYTIDSVTFDSTYRLSGTGNLKLEFDEITDEKITILGNIPE